MNSTLDKKHAARVKRARKADKPHASAYSKANVHGEMRPGHWRPFKKETP